MNPRITDSRAEYNERRFQYLGGEVSNDDMYIMEVENFTIDDTPNKVLLNLENK